MVGSPSHMELLGSNESSYKIYPLRSAGESACVQPACRCLSHCFDTRLRSNSHLIGSGRTASPTDMIFAPDSFSYKSVKLPYTTKSRSLK